MNITTKFSIGESIWFMNYNHLQKEEIIRISTTTTKDATIASYTVLDGASEYEEKSIAAHEAFASREALIENLLKPPF